MNNLESATGSRLHFNLPPDHRAVSLPPATTAKLSRATLGLPLAGTAIGASLLGSSAPRARRWGLATLGVSVGAALTRWQLGRIFTWQPTYRVELEYGRLELRHYDHQIHAETTIDDAAWGATLNQGFLRLAAYIAGENQEQRAIPMTTPVLTTVTLNGSGRRRAVSAWKPPSVADVDQLNGIASRSMVFVMPGDATLDDLPAPLDERVHLHGVPPRRMAVLAFRGRYGGEIPAQKRNELLFLVKCAGLKAASEVWFAAYDGPSTLPFLRRNEVMVELGD